MARTRIRAAATRSRVCTICIPVGTGLLLVLYTRIGKVLPRGALLYLAGLYAWFCGYQS